MSEAGMGEWDECALEAMLGEAGRAGPVLVRDGERYSFDHALTQQTLYEELFPMRRRLHLAAGESLEGLPERKRTLESPTVADRAAEPAERGAAFDEALDLGDDLPLRKARVLHELGMMCLPKGESDEARSRFEGALAIFRRLGASPYGERAERALAELARGC